MTTPWTDAHSKPDWYRVGGVVYADDVKKLEALTRALYSALIDAHDFALPYVDVIDGDEGDGPRANSAMHYAQEWDDLIERAQRELK